MRVVAFDSKKVLRKRPKLKNIENILLKDNQTDLNIILQPEFKAMLGIGVTIPDYKKFAEDYNKILDTSFGEVGFSRNRVLYKSSDLLSIFYGAGIDILPALVEKVIPHIGFIDLYFSYFLNLNDTTKPFNIGIYYEEESVQKSAAEFIDLIEGPYPAICCHAFIKALNSDVGNVYFMDHCPGLKPSTAINAVIKNKSTKFVFKGDQVNYAISVADILCRYIDMECIRNGYYLNKDITKKIGFDSNKFATTFIGPQWLRDIRPSRDFVLDIAHKYPHPIFFFFPDTSGPFTRYSKDVLETSRLFNLALDKSCELGGCVKFFESYDQRFITEQDFLVMHNQLSSDKIDELKRLACPATKIDLSFLEKNIKK